MAKIKRIIKLVLNDIAEIYLYFLTFYIISLVLSYFFESWKLFFNWKAFHISVIVLGILSLLSDKGKEFILSQKKLIKFKGQVRLDFIKEILKSLIAPFVQRLRTFNKKDLLKVGIIILVLTYALHRGMSVIDFFVLAYALVSILFIVDSRIAGVIALTCLASCPFFLIFKKETIAETMAIYAYYFLVITVLTQMREYIKEKEGVKIK